MTSEYDWWSNALNGNRGPVYDGEPQSGYYRQRRRDRTFEPVAFWKDTKTGEQRCQVNGHAIDTQRANEIWQYVNKHPITSHAYWHRIDTGAWQDNDPSANAGPEIDPAQDPIGSLKAEIEAALTGVPAYKGIESDEQASRGQTLRAALTTLSGKADKTRATEKEPHLQASRDVDARWMPIVKAAKQGADEIRAELAKWEDQKRESLKRAAATNTAPNTPPPATVIKGATGRTASVTVKNIVVKIDIDLVFKQFSGRFELYNCLMELAQKAVNAGISVPGATIEERSDIR